MATNGPASHFIKGRIPDEPLSLRVQLRAHCDRSDATDVFYALATVCTETSSRSGDPVAM